MRAAGVLKRNMAAETDVKTMQGYAPRHLLKAREGQGTSRSCRRMALDAGKAFQTSGFRTVRRQICTERIVCGNLSQR